MDAITLLKQDHKTVEKLFKDFEKAGENALKTKRQVVDKIIKELSVHAAIEEQVFYPAIRDDIGDIDEDVFEALEEHHIVKWTLDELQGMPADHERFNAKVKVLIEAVRHHVKEEETDMFPQVRKELGRKRLTELGDQMETLKPIAPTRPHPKAPDVPPANLIANTGAGAVDRVLDAGQRAVTKAKKTGKKTTKATTRSIKSKAGGARS